MKNTWIIDSELNSTFTLPVVFALSIKNGEILKELLNDISYIKSPNYGNYLSVNQINDLVICESNHYVEKWLHDNNLNCSNYADSFHCKMMVGQINEIFDVKMYKYINPYTNQSVHRSSTNYVMPVELIHSVLFVDGISNSFPIGSNFKHNTTGSSGFFGRYNMIDLHNITYQFVINNSTAGVVEFGGSGFSDLNIIKMSELNGVNGKKICRVHGYNNLNDVETQLDLEMLSSTAAGACLTYYEFPFWMMTAFSYLANDPEVPEVLSISYGSVERYQCEEINCTFISSKEYVDRCNMELIKLGLRGVTVVVASGDTGSPSDMNESCQKNIPAINSIYPAASPYVLTVGATYFEGNSTTYNSSTPLCEEYGCIESNRLRSVNVNDIGDWTTGGAFSIFSNISDSIWQYEEVNDYLNSGTYIPKNVTEWNIYGRGYPDVVSNGHSCATYYNSQVNYVDGTSCSTPLIASLIVLLNDKVKKTIGIKSLGFVNPLLYQLGKFKQVEVSNTSCTNYVCCDKNFGFGVLDSNLTKWNPVSGLGILNFGKLTEYFDNLLF